MSNLSMSQQYRDAGWDTALAQLFGEISHLLSNDASIAQPFQAALPCAPFRHQAADGSESLPILRFWPACLDAAAQEPGLTALVEAFRALHPALRWRQNPNYRQSPPDPAFLDNYGYAEICGSYGLVAADIRCGVLLLGPDTCYPPHRHPAEEIYIPLNRGAWQRGETEIAGQQWIARAPGTVIHHPPQVPHATRGLDRPLAALYLWRGDLATEAKLDSAKNPA
ncbi:MAG TPA: dimethylsulfonioproprionate lyase family protein [Dongiaceae bacterium]|nr:dimethylsulfonioproprionate lyase family protein [Dongiaceae bacterium]